MLFIFVIQLMYMNHKKYLVSDASSLILLTRSGIIEHLLRVNALMIPSQVYNEGVEKGKEKGHEDAYLIEKYITGGDICVKNPNNRIVKRIEDMFHIDAGERDTIALAVEHNLPVLCDDRKGMNACKVLQLNYLTALNILSSLYSKKKISRKVALERLDKLKKYGWYKLELIEYVIGEIK